MHAVYLLSVWLHILAATVWIGGMFFIVLVVVPWLRRSDSTGAATFLRETGERFSSVGWVCFGVVFVTGSYNLWARGVRFSDFMRDEWLASPFGRTVLLKLAAFALVLVVSTLHDFVVGPRAVSAIARDPESSETRAWRQRASLLGRANAGLGLLLVAAGVMLVRGALTW
jgi:uncharacterized membrane protein